MIRTIRTYIALGAFLLPVFTRAAGTSLSGTFGSYLSDLIMLVQYIAPIVVAVVVLIFFWGLAKFILNAGDTKEHENGRRLMIWGVIGITVMVSTVGLTRLLQTTFGLNTFFKIPCSEVGVKAPGAAPCIVTPASGDATFKEVVEGDVVPFLVYILLFLLGLAVLVFFIGVAKYMYALSSGDEKSIEDGKKLLVWGIMALFVMFSWFGILGLFGAALGINILSTDASGLIPHLQFNE